VKIVNLAIHLNRHQSQAIIMPTKKSCTFTKKSCTLNRCRPRLVRVPARCKVVYKTTYCAGLVIAVAPSAVAVISYYRPAIQL